MEELIKLIEKTLRNDLNYELDNELVNKVFYTEYLIDAHLVSTMKDMVEYSENMTVTDERDILKFDTIVSLMLNRFFDIYDRAQKINKDDYLEFKKTIEKIQYVFPTKLKDKQEKLKNKLKDFKDSNFLIKSGLLHSLFEFIEYRYVEFIDESIIKNIFDSNKFLFRKAKRAYNLLKELFDTFNISIQLTSDSNLKPQFNVRDNKKLNKQQIENISFYLCLSKETFIGFFNEFSKILESEIIEKIKTAYSNKNKDVSKEFKELRDYINNNYKRKYAETKNEKKGKRCFAIMKVRNINIFSLSGYDYDLNENIGILYIANNINKNVFAGKYKYAKISDNVKRYVDISDIYNDLDTPIEFKNDNEIDKNNNDKVGLVYGCCERKMLACYEENNNTYIDNCTDVFTFYIKYLPCPKCQPAIRNLNSEVYALYVNYKDMINKLSSNEKLKIRKAKIVKNFILP